MTLPLSIRPHTVTSRYTIKHKLHRRQRLESRTCVVGNGNGFIMTIGLAEAIDTPGPGWIPAIGGAEAFASLRVPVPSLVADILEARRQEIALLRPPAFSTVPE